MKTPSIRPLLLILAWSPSLLAQTPNPNQEGNSREAYISRDRDFDGRLSRDEYLLGRQGAALDTARVAFQEMDVDRSQSLSMAEFVDFDPQVFLTPVERELVSQTNGRRAENRVPAVKLSRILSGYAPQWSQKMADGQVPFGHGQEGTENSMRARTKGAAREMDRTGDTGSENLFYGSAGSAASPESLAATAIRSWMASEAHQRNLLSADQEYVGVGVARSADGVEYCTQIFLKLSGH